MHRAIVFGATSGIGKRLTEILIKNNYKVAVTGRRLAKLEELANEYPDKVIFKQNDIQKVGEVEKVFNDIVQEFKEVHLIVQSSGVAYLNSELDWGKEEDTILTNVYGVTKLYDLAFNLFRKQGFGHLVGISSIASIRGSRGAPSYFASKAYQKAYLESLYLKTKEISSSKVFITDIRPGFVDTAMAVGEGIFWLTPLDKAAEQIFKALKNKKRVAYVSKRWAIIAFVLKLMPTWILKKVF
ncbi:SDR family NAD(P)-dependent oxidoreductase [Tenacibaculum sp. MEBiC06402]|uniref:SDR family NAD(P)-dependent oxidoreductase n=1 Tax=unclassified Tenacibaculum TaxID=2635139 RepID=UPI003B9D20D8